jgi:CheY-like chemotaxis protein
MRVAQSDLVFVREIPTRHLSYTHQPNTLCLLAWNSSTGVVVILVVPLYSQNRQDLIPLQKTPIISVVDDDEDVRNATKALIRSLGHHVAAFASAEEFLNSEQLHQTACLISDVQMPGLNGIELQERLKADGHRIPVIFITAFPDERVRDRAMRAGAISFMSKPLSDANLIVCLDRALKAV